VASGAFASIDGGDSNTASGINSSVLGGSKNSATANCQSIPAAPINVAC
jgi:hypothetical protein